MQARRIARRYARVLVDLAEAEGTLDATRARLDAVRSACAELPPLAHYLSDQKLHVDTRMSALNSVLKGMEAKTVFGNFMRVLVERRRFSLIELITEEYATLSDERKGVLHVHVRTARQLSEEERESISKWFTARSGVRPEIHEEIMPSLIGGLQVEVNNKVFDYSIAARLQMLRSKLVNS
jgi:ATP synthase F1 delta subunit